MFAAPGFRFASVSLRRFPRVLTASLALFSTVSCRPTEPPKEAPADATKADEPEEKPEPKAELSEPTPASPERSPLEILREREAALANALLHRAAPPENHLGLALVLGARTADLPWVLVVENRSDAAVEFLGMPELLSFEVKSKAAADEVPAPTSTTKAKTKTPAKVKPTICASEAPKVEDASKRLHLRPGDVISVAFDPRLLCGREITLEAGQNISATFGFPITTKKVWKKGKSEEVTNEQEAPFVARRTVADPGTPLPLKQLTAETFVLDETYPLEKNHALVLREETEAEKEARVAREPLAVSISSLGKLAEVGDETRVNVTVKNRDKASHKLFLRREHLVYEIQSPLGGITCKMGPADRAPEGNAYDTLSPGESVTLATRLAEACPLGTFDAPGTYTVNVRLEARQSGAEHGLDAFVGNVATTEPATLIIAGTKGPAPKPSFSLIQPQK